MKINLVYIPSLGGTMFEVYLINRDGQRTTLQQDDVIVITQAENSGGRRFRVRVLRDDLERPKAFPVLRWQDGNYPDRDPTPYFEQGLLTDPMPSTQVFYAFIVQMMAAFFGRTIKLLSSKADRDKYAAAIDYEAVMFMAKIED